MRTGENFACLTDDLEVWGESVRRRSSSGEWIFWAAA